MSKYSFKDFEICDAHAHIFPEKISQKASVNIGNFYDLPMYEAGSSTKLIESGSRIGVTKYLVCSTATTKDQTASINKFIRRECDIHPEFVGFGTLHPESDNLENEFNDILSMKLHGVKLHPDFQKFNIDAPEAYKIYEIIEGKLPVLIHMGDNRYDYSKPKRLAKVINDFPKLKVTAAHLGGYQAWEEAFECLNGSENLKVDTCSSLAIISPEFAVKLINHYGVENCMFGTDFPMWSHTEELERFFALNLSYEENKKILSENFKEMFGL